MESRIIRDREDWDRWVAEMGKIDLEFGREEPPGFGFPALVVWANTDPNWYCTIEWEAFSAEGLIRIAEEMKPARVVGGGGEDG